MLPCVRDGSDHDSMGGIATEHPVASLILTWRVGVH